eukprot:366199-Chlamydomonas_euryale.AAC.21
MFAPAQVVRMPGPCLWPPPAPSCLTRPCARPPRRQRCLCPLHRPGRASLLERAATILADDNARCWRRWQRRRHEPHWPSRAGWRPVRPTAAAAACPWCTRFPPHGTAGARSMSWRPAALPRPTTKDLAASG